MPRTWMGWLNFIVLQWFGIRLARTISVVSYGLVEGDGPFRMMSPGGLPKGLSTTEDYYIKNARQVPDEPVTGYKILRWIVPMTGWWGRYRWIWRVR